MTPIVVALIGIIVPGSALFLERRHSKRMTQLQDRSDEQHNRGYDLLESMDNRLSSLQYDVGGIKSWVEQHDLIYPPKKASHR